MPKIRVVYDRLPPEQVKKSWYSPKAIGWISFLITCICFIVLGYASVLTALGISLTINMLEYSLLVVACSTACTLIACLGLNLIAYQSETHSEKVFAWEIFLETVKMAVIFPTISYIIVSPLAFVWFFAGYAGWMRFSF